MAPRTNSPRPIPRGPAAKRHGRADRDGDVAMGVAVNGAARIGKVTGPPTGPRRDTTAGKPARGGLLSATAQRAILRSAGARDVSMKEARISGARGGPVELKITGWNKSKASSNPDGGVDSLIKWLEKKASTKLGSRTRSVRIKKSHLEGDALIISVASEDVGALTRMNGYGWAGASVTIERLGGAGEASAPSSEAEKTKAMLKGVLERRYDASTKFLNLSKLGEDEELKNQKIFDSKSTASKFFPAMMKVLDLSFDKVSEKDAAIISVSLAENDLSDLTAVSSLSQTLPKLQNLDLSNNKFDKLSAFDNWRRKFYELQHLILTGNPIEQTEPNYHAEMIKRYSKLRQLNNNQVRTEEEAATKTNVTHLPFPIRSALFQDEGGIAETFVRTFFTGFDVDRAQLVVMYYDEHSHFSLAINTSAPRDPAATGHVEKQDWHDYLQQSRNLKKIGQLNARRKRLFRGPDAVKEVFAAVPATKHPDIATEARKWLVEAKMVPGVPDPTGQSPNGVDGFLITVSGEFEEASATGHPAKKRSFDRTFILGPGGPSGVRIVSDELLIRAYGGTQAFEPEMEGWTSSATQADTVPVVDQAIAEQMLAEMMKRTGMIVEYARECLTQTGWNFEAALVAFEGVKGSLPPNAFALQQPPV